MEEKLGITCAIPGRDYLRGLPLDNLDIYYKKYRTVILTLTGTSSIAERYQIDKYDSAIVVELYNMENNPSYLRNIMHINGTICEHLWFSQLATEVRNRHPGKYLHGFFSWINRYGKSRKKIERVVRN